MDLASPSALSFLEQIISVVLSTGNMKKIKLWIFRDSHGGGQKSQDSGFDDIVEVLPLFTCVPCVTCLKGVGASITQSLIPSWIFLHPILIHMGKQ